MNTSTIKIWTEIIKIAEIMPESVQELRQGDIVYQKYIENSLIFLWGAYAKNKIGGASDKVILLSY